MNTTGLTQRDERGAKIKKSGIWDAFRGTRTRGNGQHRLAGEKDVPGWSDRVASTSSNAACVTERRTDGARGEDREKHAMMIESRSTSAVNPNVARERSHDTKTFVLPFIDAVVLCGRRSAFAMDDVAPDTRSRIMRRIASSASDDTLHSQSMHHREKPIPVTPVSSAEGGRADTRALDTTGLEEIQRFRRDPSRSQTRTAELQQRGNVQSGGHTASNGFLDIADTSSDTDVIRALQKLNAELQQNATYMADYLVEDFEFKNAATNATRERVSLIEQVSVHIGSVLAKRLASRPQEVPLLLQIAFQAYFADVLGQIASAWTYDPGQNAFIDSIYQTLREAEAQATSGRWRSLARLYNLHSGINHPEAFVEKLIADISDILLVAGCSTPRSSMISKITSQFKERIILLVDLAVRLNKTFDQVISSDFEVQCIRPGDKFESSSMEETDGNGAEVRKESVVLCATHLGLTKQAPVGTLWEKGKKQKMMVLKAKVLLESLFDGED